MSVIILSVLALGALALLFGLCLGYAGVKFNVAEDERIAPVRARLPGANCGACGFIGCDDFASAIVAGKTAAANCPVAGGEQVLAIYEIMGSDALEIVKKAAFVKCGGTCAVSKYNYKYEGIFNCTAASQLANGGAKVCRYGCIGEGSCLKVCKFGAVSIEDGLAVIDNNKCTACGLCIDSCPKNLIMLVPKEKTVRVACASTEPGKVVRTGCSVGCIGCKLCEKACEKGAITVTNNIAGIDFSKCDMCGDCVAKCPTRTISSLSLPEQEKPEASTSE